MERIRIGICDDEQIMLDMLKRLVERTMEKLSVDFEIKDFLWGKELISEVKELNLVFLDIVMPQMDGMEIGREISTINENCKVVMATRNIGGYKEAFRINAFRFITKPYCEEEVEEAITGYLRTGLAAEKISAYQNRIAYDIEQRDIIYVAAYGSYIELMTEHGVFRKEDSLNNMEKVLEPRIFFRIHRKYIVNMLLIEEYSNGIVFMKKRELEVSKRKKKEFENKYAEYCFL